MRSLEECQSKFPNAGTFTGEPCLPPPLSRAACDVLNERRRQIEQEGWTPKHDDAYQDGSLAMAAVSYATLPVIRELEMEERPFENQVLTAGESSITREYLKVPWSWPRRWHGRWWKPKDRRRDLVRAAALLLAEIDRLDRIAERQEMARAADGRSC